MQKQAFRSWLSKLETWGSRQMAALKTAMAAVQGAQEVVEAIEQQPVEDCPHCDSPTIIKFGFKDELQRYRCKACRSTFNSLTGKPLARLRKKKLWLSAIESLNEKETLDAMQERLSVSRPTAIRWRKRFVNALQPTATPSLSGIVEADETFVRRGQKGTPCVGRPARKRGSPASSSGTGPLDWVCVVSARDRNKTTTHQPDVRRSKEVFSDFLTPLIQTDSILCSDGHHGYRQFAKNTGVQHVVLNARQQEYVKDSVYHIQNVNAYHSRVKAFISDARGVAAYNVGLYFNWVDHLDRLSNLSQSLSPKQIMQSFIFNT